MKKLSFFLATIIVVMVPFTVMANQPEFNIILNGTPLCFVHPNPIIKNGTTFVSLREFAEFLGAKVKWNGTTKTVEIATPNPIASIPQEKINLYPFERTGELIKGFILESKGQRKYFDWVNLALPVWEPQLKCWDINNDGKTELVVILNEAEGTGLLETKIHILNPDTFEEIPIENPLYYIHKQVHTSITKSSEDILIMIKIGGKEYLCKLEIPIDPFDNIVFGNYISFEIENKRICCTVPGQYSAAGFIGDFVIYYVYDTGSKSLIADHITFIENTSSDFVVENDL